jgi:hypothetical protein
MVSTFQHQSTPKYHLTESCIICCMLPPLPVVPSTEKWNSSLTQLLYTLLGNFPYGTCLTHGVSRNPSFEGFAACQQIRWQHSKKSWMAETRCKFRPTRLSLYLPWYLEEVRCGLGTRICWEVLKYFCWKSPHF